MRVIVAEDDTVSRLRLEAAFRATPYEVEYVTNGADALIAFERGEGPALLLLDWVMPGLDGVAVCRHVRRVATAPVYIVFTTSRARQENMVEALEAGADDFVAKPFSTQALLARVHIGERVLRATGASEFLFEDALTDAARSTGGVVVTREGARVGRVFLTHGRVAWAHVSGEPSGVRAVLGDHLFLTDHDVEAILTECRTTQKHFAEVLVGWGLVTERTMQECMRSYLARRVAQMQGFGDARAMFLPEPRVLRAGPTFALDEVFKARATRSTATLPSSLSDADFLRSSIALTGAEEIEGATSVCVLHGESGALVARLGELPEANVIRALLSVRHTTGPATFDEVTLSDHESVHFLLRAPQIADHVLYARVSRTGTLFALARMQIGKLAAALRGATDEAAAAPVDELRGIPRPTVAPSADAPAAERS
jgi:CheY-like chemotaxis protein